MKTISERLRWARERAGHSNPTETAREHGWTVSTYLGYENGDRNPSRAAAKRIARAYRVRWEWLLEGDGNPTPKNARAAIVNYVDAGSSEIVTADPYARGEGIGETDLPPGAPPDTVPVRVRGDSMYPRYFDGETLFYIRDGRTPAELIGRECVVRLMDGHSYIKILRKGSRKNLFNLESWNAPLIEDQKLEWAAEVKWRG